MVVPFPIAEVILKSPFNALVLSLIFFKPMPGFDFSGLKPTPLSQIRTVILSAVFKRNTQQFSAFEYLLLFCKAS